MSLGLPRIGINPRIGISLLLLGGFSSFLDLRTNALLQHYPDPCVRVEREIVAVDYKDRSGNLIGDFGSEQS